MADADVGVGGAVIGTGRRLRTLARLGRAKLVGARPRGRPPYVSSARPIVIGGSGRCGTTLLRRIINTHPNLCCGPESYLLAGRKPDPAALALGYGIPEEHIRALVAESRGPAEIIDRFMAEYCVAKGVPRWAEKSPGNIRRLTWILGHFPEARVVHMIRDGRDVVCSLKEFPRAERSGDGWVVNPEKATLSELVERWESYVRAGIAWRGDRRYTELRYEDLVSAPRETLQALFALVDEPFDERVMAYETELDPTRDIFGDDTVTGAATSGTGGGTIHGKSVGRWRNELSADEQAEFKRLAGPLLVELGYERDDGW
jgi:protein-tyrosine sulfotransferase